MFGALAELAGDRRGDGMGATTVFLLVWCVAMEPIVGSAGPYAALRHPRLPLASLEPNESAIRMWLPEGKRPEPRVQTMDSRAS